MADTHPTCGTAPAEPPIVSPNAYFNNLKYRDHIPMAFPAEVNDTSSYTCPYRPSLGDKDASYVYPWGTDGVNKADLKVGTVAEIKASFDGTGGE